MLNNTLNQINSEVDFITFLHSNFMMEIGYDNFPEKYKQRRLPEEISKSMDDKAEVKNIRERELIRDNIYLKYKFDIYEHPFVIFYEVNKTKKLKSFKKQIEAHNFANLNLHQGIYSMLISIMNRDIECQLYKPFTHDD